MNIDIQLSEGDIRKIGDYVINGMRPLIAPINDEVMNIEQLTRYLSVKPNWVYDQLHKAQHPDNNHPIPHFRPSPKVPRFRKSEIDKWVRGREIKNRTRTG